MHIVLASALMPFLRMLDPEAAHNLAHSKAAREMFGDPFVEHYSATREWEVRENLKWVSDWDLARYFEII